MASRAAFLLGGVTAPRPREHFIYANTPSPRVMRRPLLLCLAMLLALSACSDRSFVGRRVDNFSAYYNTFYNAQKAYDEGVEALETGDGPVNSSVYLPLFREGEGAAGPAFEQAIEKSADVLRDHPSSRWVDDALMLIGKSYFHQNNFVGAERKFREVMTRGGPKGDEARFWLARALIAAGDYDAAEEHLQTSLESGGGLGGWRAMLSLALGALRVEQGAWEEAAAALEEGLGGKVRGDEVRARAYFLLGQVREALDRHAAAAEAYARAAAERPRYELAYAAQMSAVRARGEAGAVGEALERLRAMERDDKNFEKRAEMALLRGRLYQRQGRSAEARRVLTKLLYDGDADARPSPEVQGRAHYALATLYRDAFRLFDRAAAHFDTSASALGREEPPAAAGAAQRTRAAVTDSREQAQAFGRVAEATRRVDRLDSLLRLGRLGEAEFASFIDELRRQRAREAEAARRTRTEETRADRFANRSGDEFDDGDEEEGAFGQAAAAAESSAGFLFHDNPAQAQQAYVSFVERWGRRPLVPNWRRLRAISGETRTTAAGAPAEEAGLGLREPTGPAGADIPDVDFSDVPRDADSRLAMEAERAIARYELANALFFAIDRPDSAMTWYRRVVEEGAGRPVEQRAYYAMAEAHDALGQDQEAALLYRQIAERYPESDFAERALAQLQEEDAPSTTDATTSAGLAAEAAYERAYAAWQRGAYAQALRGMTELAATHQGTDAAPRALLAAGQIALEWAARTGRSPLATLPVTLADSLTQAGGLLAASDGPPPPAPDSLRPAAGAPDTSAAAPGEAAPEEVSFAEAALPPGAFSTAEEPGPRAQTYFASLVAHYPESPHAERARLVLSALGEEAAPQRFPLADAASPGAEPPPAEAPEAAQAPPAENEGTPAEPERVEPEDASTAEAQNDAAPPQEADSLQAAEASIAEARAAEAANRPSPAEAETNEAEADEAEANEVEAAPEDAETPPAPEAGEPAEAQQGQAQAEAQAPPRAAERLEETEPAPDAEEVDSAVWRPALYDASRVVPEAGGWTVAVDSTDRFGEADAAAQSYYAEGYRAGVIGRPPGGAGPRYRIGLGQFATRAAAAAAAAHLREMPTFEEPLLLRLGNAPEDALAAEEPPAGTSPSEGQGTLSVEVRPWGAVYVDGALRRERADAPFAVPLTTGRHQVTVIHPQLGTREREVQIEAGQEQALVIDLSAGAEEAAAAGAEEAGAEEAGAAEAAPEAFGALTAAEEEAARGGAPIRLGAGGWTLVVSSRSERPQAELVAERYRRRGFRVGIFAGEAEGEAYFRVGVGQFSEEDAARVALRKLEGELPQDAWLMPLAERN